MVSTYSHKHLLQTTLLSTGTTCHAIKQAWHNMEVVHDIIDYQTNTFLICKINVFKGTVCTNVEFQQNISFFVRHNWTRHEQKSM